VIVLGLSALESVAGPQNVAFTVVISLLFLCQRANAYRDRVSGLRIEVKGIVECYWQSLGRLNLELGSGRRFIASSNFSATSGPSLYSGFMFVV